jgi:Spy/CpxP family protein refolding chaperone
VITLRAGVALVIGLALSAGAQQTAAGPGALAQPQRGPDSAGRARLEGQLRQGFARLVRQRIGLTDDQMARLGPMSQRHEQQRRQLQNEERDTRLSLRASIRNSQSADAKLVDQLLQRMVDIQKRRVQLLETEQRDLATIMTPIQRAQFMALQEQIRRRLEQMRQRRMQQLEGDLPAPRPRQRPPF